MVVPVGTCCKRSVPLFKARGRCSLAVALGESADSARRLGAWICVLVDVSYQAQAVLRKQPRAKSVTFFAFSAWCR
eukprot:1965841-Amphidinium_carterae.1